MSIEEIIVLIYDEEMLKKYKEGLSSKTIFFGHELDNICKSIINCQIKIKEFEDNGLIDYLEEQDALLERKIDNNLEVNRLINQCKSYSYEEMWQTYSRLLNFELFLQNILEEKLSKQQYEYYLKMIKDFFNLNSQKQVKTRKKENNVSE